MASDRKIAANRKNALRSTGPRSAAGKTRVSRNAVRHGLSAPIADLPVSAEMDRLARKLAGEFATPQRLEQARIAAEAEFEILRVRAHRKTHIDLNAANSRAERSDLLPEHRNAVAIMEALPEMAALERYERRAVSRRKRAMRWLMYTAPLKDEKSGLLPRLRAPS